MAVEPLDREAEQGGSSSRPVPGSVAILLSFFVPQFPPEQDEANQETSDTGRTHENVKHSRTIKTFLARFPPQLFGPLPPIVKAPENPK